VNLVVKSVVYNYRRDVVIPQVVGLIKMRLFAVILGLACILPFTGCYEIASRIVVREDLKVVMTADIRLEPAFFTTAFERNGKKFKDAAAYREQLIADFKERMKVFDTVTLVEETTMNVTKPDSSTLIHAELILPKLKNIHKVNRLFWSGLVEKPRINLPAFPNDINISMKGDSLPVLEITPVAAKYQLVYGIESIDIENIDLYSDLFDNKLCTFTLTADKFITYVGKDVERIEQGAQWQYPSMDLLLYGHTSFKPVTVFLTYPYGVMEVMKE
jgi:hypothetical protein